MSKKHFAEVDLKLGGKTAGIDYQEIMPLSLYALMLLCDAVSVFT